MAELGAGVSVCGLRGRDAGRRAASAGRPAAPDTGRARRGASGVLKKHRTVIRRRRIDDAMKEISLIKVNADVTIYFIFRQNLIFFFIIGCSALSTERSEWEAPIRMGCFISMFSLSGMSTDRTTLFPTLPYSLSRGCT